MRRNHVRCLLMGGQACVLYGAAEFSRDADFAILCEPQNLLKLQTALDELGAHQIAIPSFEARHLERGHAVHFRCSAPEVEGLRVDIMSVMRGVAGFEELWDRRTTLVTEEDEIDLLALPDLVKAKKTQRNKDWPMTARLLEANYFAFRGEPTPERLAFWFRELRTPELLIELAHTHPDELVRYAAERPVLAMLDKGSVAVEAALRDEEEAVRAIDRAYWQPLKAELEVFRRERRGSGVD